MQIISLPLPGSLILLEPFRYRGNPYQDDPPRIGILLETRPGSYPLSWSVLSPAGRAEYSSNLWSLRTICHIAE
jgi:hypothetical protein